MNARTKCLIASAVAVGAALTSGVAFASSAATSPPKDEACVSSSSRTLSDFHASSAKITCPKGSFFTTWNQQGPAGPQGPPGAPGGNASITTTTDDMGGNNSVATGGSFVTNATEVGTITLPAGTYELNVNAKATPPAGGTGAVSEFPEFFVYNQAANSSFTGDLFNVGSGALEAGTNANIDSYYSGSGIITLNASTKLFVYAFGYDSDRGAGSYILDDLTITAAQLK